jgi:uncharacterized protein
MNSYTYKYEEEFQYVSNACLNVTDACNLACRYCFVEQNPHYMTFEVAKDAADFLYNNLQKKIEMGVNKEDDKCSLTFFGGEPMLMYDKIIVPLVEYIENSYPNKFNFSMTTNGTLLNKESIDFCKKHDFSLLLSIDGDEYTQNCNRPCINKEQKSFDLVSKNIPYLLENFPNITFRSTIDQYTVEHTFENYLFAISQGFKNIFMMPNGREKWSEEAKINLCNEFDKIYQFMLFCFENDENPPISFSCVNSTFKNILDRDLDVIKYKNETLKEREDRLISPRPVSRCGLGTVGASIAYDGKIYGCQEQDSLGLKSQFYIGDIYNGINKELHNNLLYKYSHQGKSECENKELCKNCVYKINCRGHNCPSSSYDLFQSFNIDNEIHCLWNQHMAKNSAILMKILVEKNNLKFKEYLDKQCSFNKYFKKGE